jgi:hypothetical protein
VAGDTCTAISLMHKALLDVFVASNPSLASLSSCDAHLVPGLTYCAKPLSNWAEMNKTELIFERYKGTNLDECHHFRYPTTTNRHNLCRNCGPHRMAL